MKIARMLLMIVCVVTASQFAAAQEISKHDQIKIAVQAVCPMTGQKLGSMGQPLKVKIGEEEIFLCCKGCLKVKVDPKHWATIHSNFAKAQQICPVMKQKLPENAKWTIVKGQIVYICCPPCTKKIAADPATYLGKIDELYLASLRKRSTMR